VPTSVASQQQTGAASYSANYDVDHLFANQFMPATGTQQAQSPSGAYGSATPPVQTSQTQQQQQQQQTTNNDNKTINYHAMHDENILYLQHMRQYGYPPANSQQQGQPSAARSPATINYFHSHPASGPSYSAAPPMMYAQPAAALAQQQQQQASKQQQQQYNQNNSISALGATDEYYSRASSTNKEPTYLYAVQAQPQQVPSTSAGQAQVSSKQQRNIANVYNNQSAQSRSYQQ
jgi:hypothetical protein